MTFIGMLAVAIAVGILAQKWKKRTGAFWAFLTFAFEVPIWAVSYCIAVTILPEVYANEGMQMSLSIVICGGIGVLMAIVVATLPAKTE